MSDIYNNIIILGSGASDNTDLGSTALYIKNNNDMLLVECGASTFTDIKSKKLLDNLDTLSIIISSSNIEKYSSLGDLIKYNRLFGKAKICIYSPAYNTIKETLDSYGLISNIDYTYSNIDAKDNSIPTEAFGRAWIFESNLHIQVTACKNSFDPTIDSYGFLFNCYKPSTTITADTKYIIACSKVDKENVIKITQKYNVSDILIVDCSAPTFKPSEDMIPVGGKDVNDFDYGINTEAKRIWGIDRYETASKYEQWINSTSHQHFNNNSYIVACHGADKENVLALINKLGIIDIQVLDDTSSSFIANTDMIPIGGPTVNNHPGYDESKRIYGPDRASTLEAFKSWIESTPHTFQRNGVNIGWEKDFNFYYSGDTNEFGELAFNNKDNIDKFFYIIHSSKDIYPYNMTIDELDTFINGLNVKDKIVLLGLDSGIDIQALKDMGYIVGGNDSNNTPEQPQTIDSKLPSITIDDPTIPEPILTRVVDNTNIDFNNNVQYDYLNLELNFNTSISNDYEYKLLIDSKESGTKFSDKDGLYINIGFNDYTFRGEHVIEAVVIYKPTGKEYRKIYNIVYIEHTYTESNIINDNISLNDYVSVDMSMYDNIPDEEYNNKIKIIYQNNNKKIYAKKSIPSDNSILLFKVSNTTTNVAGSLYIDMDLLNQYSNNGIVILDYRFGENSIDIIINNKKQDNFIDIFYFVES